jgi:hypothetical protein
MEDLMKEVMKNAWQIVKEAIAKFGGNCREYMGEALRIAWAEFKAKKAHKDVMDQISDLEAMGFKRWQKNGMDRLYVDARRIGLEVSYYKTGNVSSASFDGYSISNSEARRMLGAKTYIDLVKRQIVSDNRDLAIKVAEICGVAHEGHEPRFAF